MTHNANAAIEEVKEKQRQRILDMMREMNTEYWERHERMSIGKPKGKEYRDNE